MHNQPEVLVIGGGMFGVASAYFLAKAGKRVTLIERGFIGAASSGANFGGLRLQGRAREQYPLSLLAQQYWENFEEEFGAPCEFDKNGMIYFARNEKGEQKIRAYADNSRQCGLEIDIWSGTEVQRNLPWMSDEATMASFSQSCATANPRLATPAIARAFKRLGGTVLENREVKSVTKPNDQFEVICANDEKLTAEVLINAAGGWADKISEGFGEEVPLFRAGPPQFVTEPLPYVLRPSVYSVEGDLIIRQIPRGNFIFAGYPRTLSTEDGKHTFVPPFKTANGMQAIARFIPALKHAEVIRVWSGVEAYLPDMLPIIGPSNTTSGLFHAFGGSGGGFQIGPAVGLCISNLVCGTANTVNLDIYGISRFKNDVKASDKLASEFDDLQTSSTRKAAKD